MRKQDKRKEFHLKLLFQKYLLLLFSLALVLSPFCSLGELAYAEGDPSVGNEPEVSEEEADANEFTDITEPEIDEPEDPESGKVDGEEDEAGTEGSGENKGNSISIIDGGKVIGDDENTVKAARMVLQQTNTTQNGFEWQDNEDNTVSITGYTGNDKTITIPDSIDGKTVTIIDKNAFKEKNLNEVTLPNTITEIGASAFKDNELIEVNLPDTLVLIGMQAFEDNKLTEVNFPDSVKVIGNVSFARNKIAKVTFPSGLTNLGAGAFQYNELTEVTLPTTIRYLENNMFKDNRLTSIEIPTNIESIGSDVFVGNPLEEVVIKRKNTRILTTAFRGIQNVTLKGYDPSTTKDFADENGFMFEPITEPTVDYDWVDNGDGTVTITNYFGVDEIVEIPSEFDSKKVTVIGEEAFANITIKDVIIPNTVSTIKEKAFYRSNIQNVTIPNSVREIEKEAFRENKLESIIIPNSLSVINKFVFTSNELRHVTIPKSVKEIQESAFQNNELQTITLPDRLQVLGEKSFSHNQLKSISFPKTLSKIGSNAFQYNELSELIIPNNIKEIGSFAFDNNQLTTLSLPDGLETIEWGTFQNNELTEITFPSKLKTIGRSAFENNKLTTLDLPINIKELGPWSFVKNNLEHVIIRNKDIVIGGFVFRENQTNSEDLVIQSYPGSKAEEYAGWNNYTFKSFLELDVNSNDPFYFEAGDIINIVNSDGETIAILEIPDYDNTNSRLSGAHVIVNSVDGDDIVATDLEIAGEVVDIIFVDDGYDPANPNEEYIIDVKNMGDFLLSLRVYNDATGDIAMYHEIGHDDWDNVGGEIEGNFITATVSEFSIYGVFAKIEEEPEIPEEPSEPEVPVKPTEPEEPEFDPCESQDPIAAGCPEDKIKDDIEDETTVTVEDTEKQVPKKGTLPNTATNRYNFLLLGGIMLVSGVTLIFFGRRRRQIIDKN